MREKMFSKLAIYGGLPIRKGIIPLNRPWFDNREIEAARAAIQSGYVVGNGPKGKELEEKLKSYLNVKHTFLMPSCTAALEAALMSLNIGSGDEVICPSFTFVSTANAIVRENAKPVFVDIQPDTYNIDPEKIKKAITKKTKAMIPVHYGGYSCDMDEINFIASKYSIPVIEDAAHAIGSKYKGKYLGTIGNIGCFSFHATKNLVCGEGGALVTNEDFIARKIEIIQEKGTDRSSFLRGEVGKYTWVGKGSSYVLSDILATIALEQFKKLGEINRRRNEHALYFINKLNHLDEKLILPVQKDGVESNWHIFPIRVSKTHRDWLIKALRAEGIEAAFHYIPLHTSPFAQKNLGYKSGCLPVTEEVSETLIRLPIYPQLTCEERDDIIFAVKKVISHI